MNFETREKSRAATNSVSAGAYGGEGSWYSSKVSISFAVGEAEGDGVGEALGQLLSTSIGSPFSQR